MGRFTLPEHFTPSFLTNSLNLWPCATFDSKFSRGLLKRCKCASETATATSSTQQSMTIWLHRCGRRGCRWMIELRERELSRFCTAGVRPSPRLAACFVVGRTCHLANGDCRCQQQQQRFEKWFARLVKFASARWLGRQNGKAMRQEAMSLCFAGKSIDETCPSIMMPVGRVKWGSLCLMGLWSVAAGWWVPTCQFRTI